MAIKKKTPPKPVKKPISGKIQKERTEDKSAVPVSAPETIQKPGILPQVPPATTRTPNADELKMNAEIELWFLTAEELAEGAEKLKRFKGINPKRVLFAAFIACPECSNLTNLQFCARYKVNKNTLWEWRQVEEVEQLRKYFLKHSMQRHTPKVLKQLKQAATTNDADWNIQLGAVKTFMAYAEDFNEKIDMDIMQKSTLTVNFANMPSSQFLRPVEQKVADKKKLQKINKKK